MTGQVGQADRDRIADQQAKDPAAAGQLADLRHQVVGDAGVHEFLELPVPSDHAECGVAGTEQIPGGVHDPPEHHRQAQVRCHCRVRAQQAAQPSLRGQYIISAMDQLFQQLIELQPGNVGKAQPAGLVLLARTLAILPSGQSGLG